MSLRSYTADEAGDGVAEASALPHLTSSQFPVKEHTEERRRSPVKLNVGRSALPVHAFDSPQTPGARCTRQGQAKKKQKEEA